MVGVEEMGSKRNYLSSCYQKYRLVSWCFCERTCFLLYLSFEAYHDLVQHFQRGIKKFSYSPTNPWLVAKKELPHTLVLRKRWKT